MSDTDESAARIPRPTLDYPFDSPPPPGGVREIVPGVLWIRMPMPFKLDHINLWAIQDGDGWTIVDSGVQSPDTASAWLSILEGPLGGRPVRRVICTHMHPDHVGMAGWLTRRFDCRLWMTRLEYLNCRMLAADTGREPPEDGIRFYRHAGWSDASLERYRARFGQFGKNIHALPDSYRRIVDRESIRIGDYDWRVVVGRGHSPEQATLHCAGLGLLISGDQVLPRISSNVSVHATEPDADPLGEWIESLETLKASIPDGVLVLPSHNEPFRGLHARIGQLAQGHRTSLDRLRRSLAAEPRRVVDVFGALFARAIAPEDAHLLSLATGESLAHLNHLVHLGEVTTELGPDGAVRYRATAEAG